MDYFAKYESEITPGNLNKGLLYDSLEILTHNKLLRKAAIIELDKIIYKIILENKIPAYHAEKVERYEYVAALLKQIGYNLDKGFIKPEVASKMYKLLIDNTFISGKAEQITEIHKAFKKRYGEYPPKFLALAPAKKITSNSVISENLDFETLRKIIREARDVFGSRFITINGSESFLYKNSGRDIFDLFREFNDILFLVFTSGNPITRELADKLADLGNVTPAITVKGFEQETDGIQGKGDYKQTLKAMDNLRNAGVPFGISVNATRENIAQLLGDAFYDFFIKEQGATYIWQFQLMPFYRAQNMSDLMVTPDQRINLYKKREKLLAEDRYPVAGFPCSLTLFGGCMAFGRQNGYFYIDWNGNIMPCVYAPYYVDNVKKLYAENKTLADALQSKFFKNGRQWQKEYGFGKKHKKNVFLPCPVLDHYQDFKYNMLTPECKSENRENDKILHDKHFEKTLNDYSEKLNRLSLRVFEEKYVLRMEEYSFK